MSAAVMLGVDVGSSGAKSAAIDSDGHVLGQGRCDYETRYPRTGWAEQDPEDWFNGACESVRSCLREAGLRSEEVAGIAFVGPAHNAALLDETGRSIRPCMHWSDLRSIPQSRELERRAGARILEASGQPVNPSWTLSQLAWLRENEPDAWKRLRKILVTKDYVRYRFTGEYVTDPFDAVGTQLCDLAALAWSEELCSLIDLDPRILPRIVPSQKSAGRLLPEVAHKLGISPRVAVAVGSGDSPVEAFGVGAVGTGDCVVKIGTSGCFNVVTDRPTTSARTLTYPYPFEKLGFTIAVTSNGTAALRWLRSKVFAGREMSFDEIVDLAATAPAGSNGLIFHPYLMGERTPYWDPRLRGGFIGLSASHGTADLARAVLEGVAFTLRDCMEAVKTMGLATRSLSLLGGGSKSQLWASITASVLNAELAKPQFDDAAVGAAKLAGVCADVFPDWRSAAALGTEGSTVVRPDAREAAVYERYFSVFRQAAAAIAPQYHELYELSQREET